MYIMEDFPPCICIIKEYTLLNVYYGRIPPSICIIKEYNPTECILCKNLPPSICIRNEYTPVNVYYERIYPPESVFGKNIPY